MKHIATVALMLNLGVAAVYAQQRSVEMTFSGTLGASAANLRQNANTSEGDFAGNGTLGPFTFRHVRAVAPSPQPPTCSGPTHLSASNVAGAGVFRFQDGSLLMVSLTQGTDCIDLMALQAHCVVTMQITGGTGRFKGVTGGILTWTETVVPVSMLVDASNNFVFFSATGTFAGTVSGAAPGD